MGRHSAAFAAVVTATFLSSRCAGKRFTASRVVHFPNVVRQGGLTPAQRPFVEQNCGPFGMPEKDPSWSFGLTRFVAREGYALEHSTVDKIPVWVFGVDRAFAVPVDLVLARCALTLVVAGS